MADLGKVRLRLPWSAPLSSPSPQIAPMTAVDVRGLRLPWMSRFSAETLSAHLRANPGLTLWVPATGEYVIAEQWRRREEIVHIAEVHARRGKQALVETLLKEARSLGCSLAILSDEVWNSGPRLYEDLKFSNIERIVFFQKDLRSLPNPHWRSTPTPNSVPLPSTVALHSNRDVPATLPEISVTPCAWEELDLLLELDHSSFPWLWWNSRAEFEEYRRMQGVHISIARAGGMPVGYTSFTMYGGWAHLDRLAVVTHQQGRRLGAAQLTHALLAMRDLGAASVALSTQQSNAQSHALYLRCGFVQTREQMNFYGLNLELIK